MNYKMGYKKIYIAVWCDSDEEGAQVQKVAEDLSATFKLSARDIIGMHPLIKKNGKLIVNVIRTVSKEGFAGVMKMAPQFVKNFKR